ncbi:DNA repair exonuclease [Hyperthermus butylicus]|uniref:DNA double-strand break repair protein Mre11 n=1 Tax=Hyperthermus butylicus (strain DSM 5456 / JCM 9403 / PLM1-5) TaxID=415426 RepID=A2BM15_HYPBU|nr:DNA repair exonuclease [Hyperthermus butylicus]ABM81026.1 putative DNA repair exonuclease [Hyperthermus butylicus DSM 5456]
MTEADYSVEHLHLLHVSDTHLGYRQYGIIEREMDFYQVFEEVIDIAIREHVDAVIHTGDLFDSTRPPAQAIRAAIRALKKLRGHGIPFIVLAGDHDTPKRANLSPLTELDEVGLAYTIGAIGDKPTTIQIDTRHGRLLVSGIRSQKGLHARKHLLDAFKQLVPRDRSTVNILLLHQALREVAPNYEVELGELPKGFSYYALGHIHLYREFRLGDAAVVYPGSPEVLRIDEAREQPQRYVVLVEVDQRSTKSLERIRLEMPRPIVYKEIIYQGLAEFKSLLVELREKLAKMAAKGVKKPLLYMYVKRLPRGSKTDIYTLVERILGSYILDYKLNIETVIENVPKTVQSAAATINIENILRELLGNDELAQLAVKLIEILGGESEKHALKEAYSIVAQEFGLDREAGLL